MLIVPSTFVPTVAGSAAIQSVYNGFLASFNACSLPGRNTALACSNVITSGKDGVSLGLRKLYWKDFDPRVSVGYRPFRDNKTVIRAGFGIFTMTTLGPMSFNNAGNPTSDLITNVNAVYNANGVLQAPQFQFPQTAPPGSGNQLRRRQPGAGERSSVPRSAIGPVECHRRTPAQCIYAGSGQLSRHELVPDAGYHRLKPDCSKQDSLHRARGRAMSIRALPIKTGFS